MGWLAMLLGRSWAMVTDTVRGFIADEAMTRGAAIACYTMFSIAPLLVVSVGIAGLAFGEDAVRGALVDQMQALVGQEGAEAISAVMRGGRTSSTGLPALVSVVVLLITASGVFAELQAALNAIWKTETASEINISVSYFLRARLLSIGLVAATGFLLLVSLLASAVLAAIGHWVDAALPDLAPGLRWLSFGVSFLLISAMFAVIYKVLARPEPLAWRDVFVGAVVTAFLFTIRQVPDRLLYRAQLGATRYGAAGALIVVLLWMYYSSEVFLLGAEFTRAWTARHQGVRVSGAAPLGSRKTAEFQAAIRAGMAPEMATPARSHRRVRVAPCPRTVGCPPPSARRASGRWCPC